MEDKEMATLGNADVYSRISIKGLFVVIVPEKVSFNTKYIFFIIRFQLFNMNGLGKIRKSPMGDIMGPSRPYREASRCVACDIH
jgi:hypothetical protein